jgi:hypothetical protein
VDSLRKTVVLSSAPSASPTRELTVDNRSQRDSHEMNGRKGIGSVMKIAALLFVVGVNLTLLLADGLVVVVGLLVTLLLSGGLGFTLHEFKRLSAKSQICDRAAGTTLDSRPADFKGTLRQLSPKTRFSESAVYGQNQAA